MSPSQNHRGIPAVSLIQISKCGEGLWRGGARWGFGCVNSAETQNRTRLRGEGAGRWGGGERKEKMCRETQLLFVSAQKGCRGNRRRGLLSTQVLFLITPEMWSCVSSLEERSLQPEQVPLFPKSHLEVRDGGTSARPLGTQLTDETSSDLTGEAQPRLWLVVRCFVPPPPTPQQQLRRMLSSLRSELMPCQTSTSHESHLWVCSCHA